MELRRSLRHAKVRDGVYKSDENFLPSTTHIHSTHANRNEKPKSKPKQKPKRAVSSRRSPRSRAPLARLDRNLVSTHNESLTRSSPEEMPVVTKEAFNTLEPTTSDPKRPKIRRSVRAPVGSSKPPTNDPKLSVAPVEKGTVHNPVSVHSDHSTKINSTPTSQTRHPTTLIDVESPISNINRNLGPVFDDLPAHDDRGTGLRRELVAETASKRNGKITPISGIDLTVSSEKATGSSHHLETVASDTPLVSSERPHASRVVRTPPVPLWRPTNMATEEEDEITPVQNVVLNPRGQAVSRIPKKSQFPATSPLPAALWRPTKMATEGEDEIIPVIPKVSEQSAGKFLQVTHRKQMNASFDIPVKPNSTKLHPKRLSSPTLQGRKPKSSTQTVPTPSKELESKSRITQSTRKPLAVFDDKRRNYSSLDPPKPSIESDASPELDQALLRVRPERVRSGTRKRVRDVHDNDLDGNDKKPAAKVYSMRSRRDVPKPILNTPSHDSLTSESDSEKNFGMRNEAIEIDTEPQRSVNQSELNSMVPAILESSNRKRGMVQTYSKRQRIRRTQKKTGQILLPSRRALGVRSASPSSEEKSVLGGVDSDNNESIGRNDKNGSGFTEADSNENEKKEEPVMDDMLKVFYMAQRQLWKEVDEISLEEEFD